MTAMMMMLIARCATRSDSPPLFSVSLSHSLSLVFFVALLLAHLFGQHPFFSPRCDDARRKSLAIKRARCCARSISLRRTKTSQSQINPKSSCAVAAVRMMMIMMDTMGAAHQHNTHVCVWDTCCVVDGCALIRIFRLESGAGFTLHTCE